MEAPKLPSTPEIKLHFLDYWRIIRMRKTIIFLVFILVVITATIVSYSMRETFQSTAKIQVDKDEPDVPGLGARLTYQAFDPFFVTTEFERIKSSSILFQVISNLDLTKRWGTRYNNGVPLKLDECYKTLKNILDLQQTRNTSLIEIRVQSYDNKEAAEIANEVSDVYKASRITKKKAQSKRGLKSYEDQVKEKETDVEQRTKELDALRKELGVVDLGADIRSAPTLSIEPQTLQRLNQNRIEHLENFTQFDVLLKELGAKGPDEIRYAIPPPYKTRELEDALVNLNSWEQELIKQQNDLGPGHPKVKEVKERINKINDQIDNSVKGVLSALTSQRNAAKGTLDKVESEVQRIQKEDQTRLEREKRYWAKKDELKTANEVLQYVRFKYSTEKVDSELPMESVVEIVEYARPAIKPYRPNIPLNIALGVVVGLLVGIGLAFFIEYLDTSVKTIDDVERAVQAPVLGVIPQNVGKLIDEGPESPHAEAYRVLRTNILFSRKSDKLNTMTIVSGGAGEGKSTTLFNLATVFAQSGERILIVDSDLRRPNLHKMFNASNAIGLTNYLLRQNTLEEVIQTTSLPSLDLMASGKLPSSSMGILSSPQMKDLINELKRRYDYVFFDSPPIMGVSDASILASQMDITLQVIQYRRYPQQMTIRAKQMIEKVGGNLIGIVLNNISMGQDDNYYYYSGYYYDYYGADADREEKKAKKASKKPVTDAKVEVKQKY